MGIELGGRLAMNGDDVALAAANGGAAPIARRRLLKAAGAGLGVVAFGALVEAPFRSAMAKLVGGPMGAQPDVAVQIFQTAASLENVAVETYTTVLRLPFVSDNPKIADLVEVTMGHHVEHGVAFNAAAEALGGARQDAPNPRYAQLVAEATPALTDVAGVIQLAATLEEAVTDTYLANIAQIADPPARVLMASVMAVEAQHLAMARTLAVLAANDLMDLLAVPTDVGRLPAEMGRIASPEPFAAPNLASPPTEGAVR
jgi:hypothetical protein